MYRNHEDYVNIAFEEPVRSNQLGLPIRHNTICRRHRSLVLLIEAQTKS